MSARIISTVLVLVPLGLVFGCSGSTAPKTHAVQGRILENGTPWKAGEGRPPGDSGIRVEFCQLSESGTILDTYSASVNVQDGTFTVPGLNGKGLPEGNYRVTVHVGAFGQPDKLKEALSRDKSKLTCQVPAAGDVVIDIGKKTLVQ